jgi:hypothetical protein
LGFGYIHYSTLAAGTYTITAKVGWQSADVKDYSVSVYSPSAVTITDSTGKTSDPSLTLYAPVVNYTLPLNATLYNTTTTDSTTTTTTTTTPTTTVTTTPTTTTTVTVPTVNVTSITTNYTTTDDMSTVTWVAPVFNLTSTLVLTPATTVTTTDPTVIVAMNAT